MKTAQQLYDKYVADLQHLQSKCKHLKQSDWMDEQWAPGHSTGRQVRVCEVCRSVIDTRTLAVLDSINASVTFAP